MSKRMARGTEFIIDGKPYTLRDIESITGVQYKTLHKRLHSGITPEELLKPELYAARLKIILRDNRLRNYHECVGEQSGLLKAIEVVSDEDNHWMKAVCKCGKEMIFKSPSSFRVARSCKSKECTLESNLLAKDINGTRYRPRTNPEEKSCSQCGVIKPSEEFVKRDQSVDGLRSECKSCMSLYPSTSKEYHRTYREENRPRLRIMSQANKKKRRAADPAFRIEDNLRSRICKFVTGKEKSARTMELIGATREFVKGYLEALFEPEMTWDNYGTEWHIDHIKPCGAFNMLLPEHQRECFHYTNLQPLWATTDIALSHGSTKIGNIEKSDYYEEDTD